MPSHWAAWLPPTDSASRTAFTLNSTVYCPFGSDDSLAICSFVHHQINKQPEVGETRAGSPETGELPD
jgi:hypothetical protein